MRHHVTTNEVQDFRIVYEIAGSHGPNENKWLNVVVTKEGLEYQVLVNRKIVHLGMDLDEAVLAYNSVGERK
jgi:hypothetical protein